MSEETPTFAYFQGKRLPRFATETERQVAEILDYYRIPWDYEPRTFILEWDDQGNILEAFTPDFYLPDLDIFLEVTEMKQSLVTPKHRKVRKMGEKYPDVRVKLFHKHDFVHLAKKYDLTLPRLMPGHPISEAVGDIYLDQSTIAERVVELGAEITRDYQDKDLLMLSLLKGAIFFMADLSRQVKLPLEMDYLAITSYRKEHNDPDRRSVRLLKDVERPLEGKDVLVVQDIVDTGLTLHYVLRILRLRNPASLEVCTLLDRPYRRLADIPVRYRGFTVPDDFFVGYGFDYHQRHRNLPYLAHLLI